MPTPNAPTNMSILFTGRKFLEATRSPAPAVLGFGGRFPGVSISDTTPPSVPQNLQATAISSTQINLSWSASTDTGGAGLAGYRVYRDGSNTSLVPTFTGTTFSNTGLTPATAYTYRVTAVDNVGNESGQSNQAVATTQSSAPSIFPLKVNSGERFVRTSADAPFLLHGDTPWSLVVQLSDSEIAQYLTDRAARGFNIVLFNAIEHYYTSQTPEWLNKDGLAPFATMTDFGSALVSAYWARIDFTVNTAKSLNVAVMMNPAYLGYSGTEEGWDTEVAAESDADLTLYGQRLAQRYTQGNIIWCMGGDQTPSNALRDKQWRIIEGIRSVRTTDIVTAHSAPQQDSTGTWGSKVGYNLNFAYAETADVYTTVLNAYNRSPSMATFMGEAVYENERLPPPSAAKLRAQVYQALFSGACGQFFGNSPIWHMESTRAPTQWPGTWQSNLNSAGSQQQTIAKNLVTAFSWWLLQPKTDTSLVTTSLSSGANRICPTLASDGSFAFVYRPTTGSSTVNMAALASTSVRARMYDPTTGSYTAVSGSPFTNSGTRSFTWSAEGVLVLDAQPGGGGSLTLVHGQAFDVPGSGYGTRSVLRDVFDNCDASATLASRWNDAVNMAYYTPAALGINVDLPHPNNTRYAAGLIRSGDFNTYNAWLSTAVSGYTTPTKAFISVYRRMGPGWVYGTDCNTGAATDNNYKFLAVSANSVFLQPYWYHDCTPQKCNANASWGDSFHASGALGTIEVRDSQSGGSTRPLEDPWLNWCRWEWRLGMGSSNQGIKFLINNVIRTSRANGLNTDNSAITTRAFSIGGYGRSGPAGRWVLLADAHIVVGTDAYKRVMVTNTPTYDNNLAEPQRIISWNGTVSAMGNKGNLSAGTGYIWVFDANDVGTMVGTITIQ